MSDRLETATLGAGCFWCVEAVFQELKGVHSVVSGYAGGATDNPTYYEVCSGTTGHAEVVQVTFDPTVISFAELLSVFWRTHDPTTLNRQGADVGTQYRSVIFYHSEEQRAIAEQAKQETDASGLWPRPIVTEIAPFTRFYPAEESHQNFYRSNPYQPYCLVVIDPKLRKLRKEFEEKLNAPVAKDRWGPLRKMFLGAADDADC
jgi:peptide-methionine (S)-S-oxide reductase